MISKEDTGNPDHISTEGGGPAHNILSSGWRTWRQNHAPLPQSSYTHPPPFFSRYVRFEVDLHHSWSGEFTIPSALPS